MKHIRYNIISIPDTEVIGSLYLDTFGSLSEASDLRCSAAGITADTKHL